MGEISLRFEKDDGLQNVDLRPDTSYEMIESPTYFETYKHVLLGLQFTDQDSLPFSEYILNQRDNDKPVAAPRYLSETKCEYDFTHIMRDPTKTKKIQSLNFEAWPNAEELGLDVSQYSALKSGLTKEFALIQGPPGTGKTFIGLKIVEVLLANERVWNPMNCMAPILIVCYTNHALDQFLEGILEQTPIGSGSGRLIRIGGQSKCEKLKSFQLEAIKNKQCNSRRGYNGSRRAVKYEMNIIKMQIAQLTAYIQLSREEIINAPNLRHAECVFDRRLQNNTSLLMWLMADNGLLKLPRELNENISISLSNFHEHRIFVEQMCRNLDDNNYQNAGWYASAMSRRLCRALVTTVV